jgi:transcription antitermination factor NusG
MREQYHWYPVYTNPRAEKKTYEQLVRKSIEVYLPLKKTLKQWSDRKKWVQEPLISSYLFVYIKTNEMATVLTTPGISRFIYFSGKVATIPEKQIEQIKRLLQTDSPFSITTRQFEKGEQVQVIAGPLQGLTGELIEYQSEKRILLRVGPVGESLLVQVSPGIIASF